MLTTCTTRSQTSRYFGGITLEWQAHIAKVIHEADGGRHLISQNIANGSTKVSGPDPRVSIFNFHYFPATRKRRDETTV